MFEVLVSELKNHASLIKRSVSFWKIFNMDCNLL